MHFLSDGPTFISLPVLTNSPDFRGWTDLFVADRAETLHELFARSNQTVKRYVEIGPRTVLVPMAQKTAKRKFSLQSTSCSIQRQFLSYTDDTKELYYEYDTDEKPVASKPLAPLMASDQPPTAPAAGAINVVPSGTSPAPATVAAEVKPFVAAAKVTDIPLSATDIVIALTAQKLRKEFDQVTVQRSIRDLSGGVQFRLRADLHLLKGL